jgi:hypothetical protein
LDTSAGNSVLDTATLGEGTPGFNLLNSWNVFTYGAPQGPQVGDFNGDGILDIASAGDSSVTILLGNGDGTFTAKSILGNCGVADAMAVADFNGDGIPDMAVTCPPSSAVNIYLGNGDGTFTLKSSPATGNWPNGVAVADFNDDGIPDLAVANAPCCGYPYTPYLTILVGNGDGTFTAAPNAPAPSEAWDVKVGDFNGDGIPDLVFSNQYGSDNSIVILLGNGDGTFTAAPSVATGNGNNDVHVGDFNGDGKEDMALIYADGGNTILKMMMGNGDGTFTAAPGGPITFPYSANIDQGDFNGDGVLDLYVMDFSDETVTLMLGNGDGTFTTTASIPTPLSQFAAYKVGDFNGDGISDIVFNGHPTANTTVAVLLTQMAKTATATASGISVGGASGTHQVEASYPGDSLHASSVSGTTPLQANGPAVSISATSLSFGSEPVGAMTASQSVTLTNSGDATLDITSIVVGGANPSSYGFANSCASVLAAGANCIIHGHFAPTTSGSLPATITIVDSASNSPQTIALSGTGVNAPPITSLSATGLSFGTVSVGGTSASQTVTLTNTGGAPLLIGSITVTGANASSFVFASSCGTTLAAGANCVIHGHLAPTSTGAMTAAVTITDNAAGSPQSVALTGTGTTSTTVSLSATSLAFGNEPAGSLSASQSVTLRNTSSSTVTISSIAVTGSNAGQYGFANSCGTSLAAGANCTIHGHFAPQQTGSLPATITITDNVAGSPQSISLTGTGTTPNPVTLSATSLSFGTEPVGDMTASQTVTMTNSGSATLNITSITVTGANATSFDFANSCGTTLAAGANCIIHGHFAPTTTGSLPATIKITDNATNSPQTIALSGTGQ